MSDLRAASPLPVRAVILGVGGCTSVGRSAVASAAAARAGISHFSSAWCPRIAGPHSFNYAAASYLPPFDPGAGASVTPRLAALSSRAATEAAACVPLAKGTRVTAIVGFPSPRPGLSDDAADAVTHAVTAPLARTGASVAVEVLPLDHAAGLAALVRAIALLQGSQADVVFAGGVDSYLSTDTLTWLHGREQLKSEQNPWGFVAGEGAGFLCLVSPAFAASRKLSGTGTLAAAAAATEEVAPRGSEPSLGKGLTAALKSALAVLPEGARVNQVVCDLNGERWRGDEVGFSIPRVASRLAEPGRFTAPATSLGDVGAASGALFFGMAAHAATRGYARGPTALAWTSAAAGPRAAALFHIPCIVRE